MFKCYHYVVCVKLNKTRKILRIFFKNEATKNIKKKKTTTKKQTQKDSNLYIAYKMLSFVVHRTSE